MVIKEPIMAYIIDNDICKKSSFEKRWNNPPQKIQEVVELNITVFREIVENIMRAWNIDVIANLSLKQIRKKMCSLSLTNLGEKITNFGKFRMQNTLISLHNEEKEEDRENANGCQSYGIAT